MGIQIQFIIFVTLAYIITDTGAQVMDTFYKNLQRNLAALNKEETSKKVAKDYDDDDYYYEEKDEYKPPPPPPPSKGPGRYKAKDSEHHPKGSSDAGGGTKKHPASRKEEAPSPRPAAGKGAANKVAETVPEEGSTTLHVLTVRKFMFQAQPVVPVGKSTPEMTKLYYYL